MLQAAGDFGFQLKAGAAIGVARQVNLDFFQGDFAPDFFIAGDEDDAQASLGMRAQYAET